MRGAVFLLLLAASCASAAAPQSRASAPEPPEEPAVLAAEPSAVPEALALWTPSHAPGNPPKAEGHLGHRVCIGPIVVKDPPHEAACCYPAKELLIRPIRAAYPALRACYEARRNKAAEGRVTFSFRIELDGSVRRVCATEDSTMDDEPAVQCLIERVREVRWPAMSTAERDLCGLVSLNYPVVFEP